MAQDMLAAVELASLLKSVCPNASKANLPKISVDSLALDSREIKPGTAFVALRGYSFDGNAYIGEAVRRGAPVVLAEADADEILVSSHQSGGVSTPIIHIPHLRRLHGHIAADFYGHPSKYLSLMGITGTNGKTSIAHMTANVIRQLVGRCGLMGTLGVGVVGAGANQKTINTTPDAISIQRALHGFREQKAKHAVMEVSSHALEQERVQGCLFKSAVFTNLTRDHLDYHETMTAYGAAKSKLFNWPGLENAVINVDDEFGRALAKTTKVSGALVTVAVKKTKNAHSDMNIVLENLEILSSGMKLDISSPWGEARLNSPLMGHFNLYNLMSVFGLLMLEGFQLKEVVTALEQVPTVPGRMQVLGGKGTPRVVVDYAHTPDALKVVLQALKEHSRKKLICVFGCGGDRDKGKRPLMGSVAESHADKLIITDDNPRSEDPKRIVQDILAGLSSSVDVEIIHDRKLAIGQAIKLANPEDVVLVAGKGHEDYQQIGSECYPFDDAEEVKSALRKVV